jgi:hypothetical protein
MAWAICKACGRRKHWRAQRGQRLADRRCQCGGKLTAKTAGRPSEAKGLSYTVCAICERRTLKPVILTVPVRVWGRAGMDRLLPAGSRVCRWHEARVNELEAVELGFLRLEEPPSPERTWGVPIPEYLAKRAEREPASMR